MSKRIEIREEIIQMTAENNYRHNVFSKNFDKIDLRGLTVKELVLNNIDFLYMFNNGCFFEECQFIDIKFSNSDFRGVIFQNIFFKDVIFENSSVINAEFVNCSFENVQFDKCDLTGSNIGDETGIKFNDCNIYKTDIKRNFLTNFSSLNIFDFYYHHILMLFKQKNSIIIPKIMYLICRILLNCDIPLHSIEIGQCCRFGHLGFGVTVVGNTKIGDNAWIGPHVNIFSRKGNIIIGKNCIIGIGSKIGASIGNNVIISAGALVVDDVPDNAIVYGQKSKIIV